MSWNHVCIFFHFFLSDAKRFLYGCFSLQYTNLPLLIDHSMDDNQPNQYTSSCSFLFFVFCVRAFFCFAFTDSVPANNSFNFRTATGAAVNLNEKLAYTQETETWQPLLFDNTIKGNKCFLMTEITQKIKFIKATIRWRYFSTNERTNAQKCPKRFFCLRERQLFQTRAIERKKWIKRKKCCKRRIETAKELKKSE